MSDKNLITQNGTKFPIEKVHFSALSNRYGDITLYFYVTPFSQIFTLSIDGSDELFCFATHRYVRARASGRRPHIILNARRVRARQNSKSFEIFRALAECGAKNLNRIFKHDFAHKFCGANPRTKSIVQILHLNFLDKFIPQIS
ncbi:hypothetical protein [Campylobacter gracilis]|uniref:Uncharacterized protein n=1 Tax=Campylobacter gracilis RM3268 TaxID=553220 RepID=C8PET1_9BACT|nr:hypothetical protein [Campylobacter gracilis]AKT91872.1 hypothetical protein CGRAC_0407 [Campylobacter gracilis]EEV18559.1 hypothetical protein CAMGR0001_2570 [Campylobacter gracilis RM3268]UEB45923.1 hypothetical protein LK410_02170 [Campylobacter gracilis]SUW77677.1 Uncharacterised protein [Campylobacter gracilis]